LSKADADRLPGLCDAAFRLLNRKSTEADVRATRELLALCARLIDHGFLIPPVAAGIVARVLGMGANGVALSSLKMKTTRGRRIGEPKPSKKDEWRLSRLAFVMLLFKHAGIGTSAAAGEIATWCSKVSTELVYKAMRAYPWEPKDKAETAQDIGFLVHQAQGPELEKLLKSTSQNCIKLKAFIAPYMQ